MTIQSVNLPVFQEELVDGGLAVTVSNITSDAICVIGFAAEGKSSADLYINTPLLINKGDAADSIFGLSDDHSTLSQAVYELTGAGANNIWLMNLGQWGTATFIDQAGTWGSVGTVYDLFDSDGNGGFTINKDNYFRALDLAYDLLANFINVDILLPADAFAMDGVVLVTARPNNFSYQLAQKCYEMSNQNHEVIGVINMPPAVSGTLAGVATYIGTAPTLDPVTGAVTASGTGLLGMPYLAGAPSGYPGYTVLPGYFEANFDLTSANFGTPPLSTSELLLDRKGNRVDIGKYLSIVADEPTYANQAFAHSSINTYNGLGATAYAGLVGTLVPHRAPTNKPLAGMTGLRYAKSIHQLDLLTGTRYVTFKQTNRGTLVTDAPTAARSGSDYSRLQVMRIVEAVMKMVRLSADPYIGEPNSAATENALTTAVDKQLKNFVAQGALRQFDFKIVTSDTDRTLGNMNIYLTLVPQFEIRKINVVVTIKANI